MSAVFSRNTEGEELEDRFHERAGAGGEASLAVRIVRPLVACVPVTVTTCGRD